jgi:phage FluMu gp28-like protein
MIVSGTPWGDSSNQFYKLVHNQETHNGQPLWSKSIIDIHQAVTQGRKYDTDREQKQSDPDKWAREMLLQWIEGSEQWLSSQLLDKAESPLCSVDGSAAREGRNAQFFLGNDIGLRGDRWVAWVLQRVGDQLVTVEVVALKGAMFEDHHRVIERLMRVYNPVRFAIDQGGMGEGSTELYTRLYGSRVEGVIFNPNNKGEMAVRVKREMEAGKLLIPAHQHEIRADLRSLTRTISAAGNIRFDADRNTGGHADYYTALALATSAAIDSPNVGGFRASGRRQKERTKEYAGW